MNAFNQKVGGQNLLFAFVIKDCCIITHSPYAAFVFQGDAPGQVVDQSELTKFGQRGGFFLFRHAADYGQI
jgi:hypothetical protein